MRLHRQYGQGLKDLKPTLAGGVRAQSSPDSDPATDGVNADGTQVINGYTFDTTSWKSFPLGVVSGLQYNNNTFGKCFYAVVDTINFADYFQQDVENLLTEGDFYQLIVYDPIRLLSNYLALYE